MNRTQTPTDDYVLALICLIQAVDLLMAVIHLKTSPANKDVMQALERVDRLIANAKELMGMHKLEGE